ncbi:CRISPR-associated endoribonuclease Cse3 (plasmid) [Streptomyces sp. ADI95-16]|uniref:type I-E CRISPR-associated protein Cas6/Cse3/CasE n=1 Tax=Streptomyces sp. ADI95-16 TaxID=1522758 RepID=UPI000F3A8CB0|nr:type I-E CRISPR-associated protein Cas6/Cse3/CasE [Streptomyces sp. ADI95-16]AYV32988.1 CRISPR-associated endoribonuclease Cse3 [Streptomyces sp. ADI95-16]
MTTHSAVLARIRLNLHHRAVNRDLRDATEMHRTLMKLVPDSLGDSARMRSGLLYRIDVSENATTLLVQASAALTADRLPDGYGELEVKDLRPMFAALRPGLGVRYRIAVNPAKRARLPIEEKNKRGSIVPLSGPDADQWWTRRAAEAGLQLKSLLPTPLDPARRRSGPPLRHSLVRYDGTATVTDPAALTTALLSGIGRGKPYGAGLLTLAPATAA